MKGKGWSILNTAWDQRVLWCLAFRMWCSCNDRRGSTWMNVVIRWTKGGKKLRWYIEVDDWTSRLIPRLCTFGKKTLEKRDSALLPREHIELGMIWWNLKICLGFIFILDCAPSKWVTTVRYSGTKYPCSCPHRKVLMSKREVFGIFSVNEAELACTSWFRTHPPVM